MRGNEGDYEGDTGLQENDVELAYTENVYFLDFAARNRNVFSRSDLI